MSTREALRQALQQYISETQELEACGHLREAQTRDEALFKMAQQLPQPQITLPQLYQMVTRLSRQLAMHQMAIQRLQAAQQPQPQNTTQPANHQPMDISIPAGGIANFQAGNASEINIDAQV